MSSSGSDKAFAGSIPRIYDKYVVPLFFEPYAADLAARLTRRSPYRVLELAAGTGVVTRALDSTLPEHVSVVATDLNQPMLDHAAALGTKRPVEWRRADAMALPFADETFDAVVCQFGVMFFSDKVKAFSEAHRVLRPGCALIFSVWDRLEHNELALTASAALASLFPDDPPLFLQRTPHAYHARAHIGQDLARGGFHAKPEIVTIAAQSRAGSPRDAAIAICQGTPLRNELEAGGVSRLGEATAVVADAFRLRFGRGAVEARMQAHVVTVERTDNA